MMCWASLWSSLCLLGGVSGERHSSVLADEGSLLLQSQVRKPQGPQDVANAVSEEMLRELGVTPSGELAQVDSTSRSRGALNSSVDTDPKDEALVQIQHFEPPKYEKLAWPRSKQFLQLLQIAFLQRSESLAEGVMLFVLCNIFLCAVVSGICFIMNG